MFGELVLDRLEVADALAERAPLERVRARHVVRGLRDADRLRADADPSAVEGRHRDAEAAVLLAEQPVPGTSASTARSDVDDEFSPSFSSSRVTSTCAASSTNADTPREPALRLVGAREEQERAGERAVGDPLLRAGDRASRPPSARPS